MCLIRGIAFHCINFSLSVQETSKNLLRNLSVQIKSDTYFYPDAG